MTHRTPTAVEHEALMIRHQAALRLLRSDPGLTPEEALMMVVAPDAAVRAASLRAARAAFDQARQRGCSKCGTSVDEDGSCGMCGHVSLDAAGEMVTA